MKKGKIALVISVTMAILSFILMKVMYIVDPISSDTGLLTTIVFMFVNFPMWIMSGIVFIYGIYILIKEKKKISYEGNEEVPEIKEAENEEEK